ncbi:5-bromo-4-chloroindolyl phosphate hydrolysis family protein [Gracilibacillus sp. HCP3S3_G5_1]|uniref:5-bromo-4-chloroindolyl phosphate hydrolysis family protein n=1 Tax=unclassified Gracilibacillus TaxID=2625209 RepID=UPI003F88CA73
MYKFLTIVIGVMITIPLMVAIWLISFFAFDLTYWYASGISLVGACLTYLLVSFSSHIRYLKKNQLNWREYRYIRNNLAEARLKIRRLQKALFSIHHLPDLKENMELLRVTKKIYRVTKNEPKRFYQGDQFFFSHLDSVVELTEKYALLSSQPTKNSELKQVLTETHLTIKDIKAKIENDLHYILSNDMEQLQFEVDYAKQMTKTKERLDEND